MIFESKKNNEPTYLAWPSGEWSNSLLKALAVAGIPIEGYQERRYAFSIPMLNIVANISRAGDVPKLVKNPSTAPSIGIVGNDILQEYNLQGPNNLCPPNDRDYYMDFFPPLPLRQLVPTAPNPRLMWLRTPNAKKDPDDYDTYLQEWAKGTVYTSYPNLAAKNLPMGITLPIVENPTAVPYKDLPQGRIEKVAGKVESYWRNDSRNYYVADIVDKGETATANELVEESYILSSIYLLAIIDESKAYLEDLRRLQDFLALLDIAVEKKEPR